MIAPRNYRSPIAVNILNTKFVALQPFVIIFVTVNIGIDISFTEPLGGAKIGWWCLKGAD
jgi:hypothetical protein